MTGRAALKAALPAGLFTVSLAVGLLSAEHLTPRYGPPAAARAASVLTPPAVVPRPSAGSPRAWSPDLQPASLGGRRSSPLPIRVQIPRRVGRLRRQRIQPRRPGPLTVARRFLVGWLTCVYHQIGCRHIPGLLPAYAHVLEPQLALAPVTQADRSARPGLASVRVVVVCPDHALTIARYRIARHQVLLHANLVLEPDGWQVFDLPEAGVRIPLPHPLAGGDEQC